MGGWSGAPPVVTTKPPSPNSLALESSSLWNQEAGVGTVGGKDRAEKEAMPPHPPWPTKASLLRDSKGQRLGVLGDKPKD